ncbi:hypothetical protein QNM99_28055 [Pseudomonas sp. PCH446]
MDALRQRFIERLEMSGLNLSSRETEVCVGLLAGARHRNWPISWRYGSIPWKAISSVPPSKWASASPLTDPLDALGGLQDSLENTTVLQSAL